MISLRKSISELERLEIGFRSALDCYLSAVASVEQFALAAPPDIADPSRRALQDLQKELGSSPGADVLARSREGFTRAIKEYGGLAAARMCQQEKDLREIVALVQETAGGLATRSVLYNTQFQGVAGELEAAAGTGDAMQLQQRLKGIVRNLKQTIECLWEDNQKAVGRMQSEVKAFHEKLRQAEELAQTDPLTGLLNRRAAEARIGQEIEQERPFCLIVLDLNGFKSINDHFGHSCGDQVLTAFSKELRRHFRADDEIYRWGGDEFVVVMCGRLSEIRPTFDSGGSIRMRVIVNSSGKQITLAVSAAIGVTEHVAGETAQQLFSRADSGMYKEKSSRQSESSPATVRGAVPVLRS